MNSKVEQRLACSPLALSLAPGFDALSVNDTSADALEQDL